MKFAADFRKIARESLRGKWVIAMIAGLLASFAIEKNVLPVNVWENKELFDEFCAMIEDRGIQRYWDENNLEAGYERVKKLKTFA